MFWGDGFREVFWADMGVFWGLGSVLGFRGRFGGPTHSPGAQPGGHTAEQLRVPQLIREPQLQQRLEALWGWGHSRDPPKHEGGEDPQTPPQNKWGGEGGVVTWRISAINSRWSGSAGAAWEIWGVTHWGGSGGGDKGGAVSYLVWGHCGRRRRRGQGRRWVLGGWRGGRGLRWGPGGGRSN